MSADEQTARHDGASPGGAPASASTNRALTVLETLLESDEPLTLTSLSHAAGVPLATCASIVQTFEQRGYARRRVVGRSHFWQPTLRLYALTSNLIRSVDPAAVAQQHLRRLSDSLGVPAHLGVLEGNTVVYVAKAATPGFVQFDTYIGKVAPYNLTALGRAITAFLPANELEPLLTHLTSGAGPNARGTGRTEFKKLLREVRAAGYAVEDQEEQAEIACVAAPVFDAAERVAYAVGITGFAKDVMGEQLSAMVSAVREAAVAISTELGSSGRGARAE